MSEMTKDEFKKKVESAIQSEINRFKDIIGNLEPGEQSLELAVTLAQATAFNALLKKVRRLDKVVYHSKSEMRRDMIIDGKSPEEIIEAGKDFQTGED